jgi:hypothetical protein
MFKKAYSFMGFWLSSISGYSCVYSSSLQLVTLFLHISLCPKPKYSSFSLSFCCVLFTTTWLQLAKQGYLNPSLSYLMFLLTIIEFLLAFDFHWLCFIMFYVLIGLFVFVFVFLFHSFYFWSQHELFSVSLHGWWIWETL